MQKNVLEWLERTADRIPEKIAFQDSTNKLTFQQVLTLARAAGSGLCRYTSSRKPIAVLSGRHCATPVLFLGVVYSGCFYVPLDPTAPVLRLNRILQQLSPVALVVDQDYQSVVQKLDYSGPVIEAESLLSGQENPKELAHRRAEAGMNDPLYVIYTSGSSGQPKGVVTSHQSLMCYIQAYGSVMKIEEQDILGNQSPLDYIAAIRDIYLPLWCGASTFIIPKQAFSMPGQLFSILNEQKVSAIGWSVSALTIPAAMGAFDAAKPVFLQKICFSGSVMPCRYLKIWQQALPDAVFVNQYGPTEATASCTYYVVDHMVEKEEILPIGQPYEQYKVLLLSETGQAVPAGEIGEICISGPILALGYYNDLERTNEAFIQSPFHSHYREMIYKTGDLGRLREDGMLMFHGRKDRQIKHLGHRVELGEIEAAAKQIPEITECAALYYAEKEQIYLFYTGSADSRGLSLSFRKQLPGFMIPRKFVKIEEMPCLPNGKIDFQALTKQMKTE